MIGARLNKYHLWTQTFKGALFWALFCLGALFLQLSNSAPSLTWVIVLALCCCYWVNIARKALKGKSENEGMKLTDDQEQRIKKATEEFHATMKEVELELTQAMRVAKEKADESTEKS